jgi:hypothetical protein
VPLYEAVQIAPVRPLHDQLQLPVVRVALVVPVVAAMDTLLCDYNGGKSQGHWPLRGHAGLRACCARRQPHAKIANLGRAYEEGRSSAIANRRRVPAAPSRVHT